MGGSEWGLCGLSMNRQILQAVKDDHEVRFGDSGFAVESFQFPDDNCSR